MKLDLPYLSQDRDRHGNLRTYFRREGQPKVRLRAPVGTPEFLEEYRAAAGIAPALVGKAVPGSLRWLCVAYYASGEYQQLDPRTRHVRKLILEKLCQSKGETSGILKGDRPYRLIDMRHVRALRDERVATPEAANSVVKALRQLFSWAIAVRLATANPARDVGYLKGNPEGFHTWTLEEVEQYRSRHPAGTKAHLALSLLLFTGVRRSDVVGLGRQMVRSGWLSFTETKGRKRKPKQRSIPLLAELQAALDATPSGHLTFLVTAFGAPFSIAGFGNWFRARCDEAGLKHCSAHGLRKAGATIAAENGATDRQLMAIYGWESAKQATLYTRQADRRRLAGDAMHLLVPRQEGNEIVPPEPAAIPPVRKLLK